MKEEREQRKEKEGEKTEKVTEKVVIKPEKTEKKDLPPPPPPPQPPAPIQPQSVPPPIQPEAEKFPSTETATLAQKPSQDTEKSLEPVSTVQVEPAVKTVNQQPVAAPIVKEEKQPLFSRLYDQWAPFFSAAIKAENFCLSMYILNQC